MRGRKGVLEGGSCQPSRLRGVDVDFPGNRRDEIKAYLEARYNKNAMQRVFSAGTFTTEKIRSVIKDVARVHKVSTGVVEYYNKIIDEGASWTDVMKLAFENKKVRDYIQRNYDVFEDILPLMLQPRSAGIHASAVIVVPEYVKGQQVECFDVLPIRKMDGLLVSEISGNDVDAIGLLKNDILGIVELERISDILQLVKENYGHEHTIDSIISGDLNDPKVYNLIRKGLTQGVFQMSGDGITRYIMGMKPDNINDLIASVALFRPGTLDSGAAAGYVKCKNGQETPEYLWGTYEILKDTFGYMCYQEQISQTAQKIGSLSLGDGVNLVKALSKKKLEKVRKFQDKYFEGAKKNGCPKEVAERIWSNVEDAAKYSFNKSHATAYGLTGYIGAWLKAYYPTAFYTVILKHQDEKKLPKLMNEMRAVGGTTISQPNINISGVDFVTDFNTGLIHWSLSRIKMLGVKAVKYIMDDRDKFGPYVSIEEFLDRIFKYKMKKYKYWNDPDNRDEYEQCPVNARSVKHLIMAGAFDEVENVKSVVERYGIMMRAAEHLGFTIKETEIPEDLRGKHYFWSEQQIKLSGMGEIDYERVFNEEGASHLSFYPLHLLDTIYDQSDDIINPAVCATITEIQDKSFKDRKTGETKHFGKIQVRQNTDIATIILWPDAWEEKKHLFNGKVGRMFISAVMVKYSDYEQKYAMNITPKSFTKIL